MKSTDGTFACQNKTGQNRVFSQPLSQNLVHADRSQNITATLRPHTGQNSRSTFRVTTNYVVRVVKSVNEVHLVPN